MSKNLKLGDGMQQNAVESWETRTHLMARPGLIKDPTLLMASHESHRYKFENMAIDQQLTWLIPAVPDLERLKKMSVPMTDKHDHLFILRIMLKNSGIYAIASCLSPLVSLFMTPFLTHHLSGSDYGILTIFNATLVLLAGLTQLGLGSAFVRLYHQSRINTEEQTCNSLLVAFVSLTVVISLMVTIALLALAPWIAQLWLHNSAYSNLLRLNALILLLQNLTIPVYTWLRTQSRALLFVLFSALNLMLNLFLTILLVGVWQWGSQGAMIASGGGYACVVLGSAFLVVKQRGWQYSFHWDVTIKLIVAGLSTLPGFLAIWILQLSDRYFLLVFCSLSQTASYTVAYTLGNLLGPLVITPFSLSWHSALYSIAKKPDALELFRQIFRFYGLLVLLIVFTVSVLAKEVLVYFFLPAYASAAAIIPLIALANLLYGFFEIFSLGILLRGKLYFNVILLPVAALINLGCNYVLIPEFGVMGAAVSTLLAYGSLAGLAYIVNQRLYPVSFETGLCSVGLIIGFVLFMVDQVWVQHVDQLLRWCIGIGLIGCYAVCLWFLSKAPAKKMNKFTT